MRRISSSPSLSVPFDGKEAPRSILVPKRHSDAFRVRLDSLSKGDVFKLDTEMQIPSDRSMPSSGRAKELSSREVTPKAKKSVGFAKLPALVQDLHTRRGLETFWNQCAVEESHARKMLASAIESEDVHRIEEAIVIAKAAGIESAKITKAEGLIKQLRAKEVRQQLQAEARSKTPVRPRSLTRSGSRTTLIAGANISVLHRQNSGTKVLMDADTGKHVPTSLEAQAVVAGMMDAWTGSHIGKSARAERATAEKHMQGVRRQSKSENNVRGMMRKECGNTAGAVF